MNTEITLPVPELKSALGGLNKLVGKRTTLPVLSHVKVSRKSNGQVTLQATDLDAHATYRLTANQPGAPVELLVPLEQLNKAFKCSAGTKQDMALVCEGKTTKLRYFIGGNPVHQPIITLPVNEWPPTPEINADSTQLPPSFGEALKQAMACCSEDQSRQVLRGACLDGRDKEGHYIIGTNGTFLYSANSFTFPFKDAVIVPDSKFINGSGLLDGEPCFLSIQPGKKPSDAKHICLQNKQWEFVTREIEGQYPNWKQVVPSINGSWTRVQLRQPAIEQLLKVIPNLPGNDGNTNTIRLRIDKVLWVEGKQKDDKEWTKIAIPDVVIAGKAKEIALNRDYLLPALKFGLDEMAVQDELSPMVVSKAGKQMVIMPVNLKGPQTTNPSPPQPATQPKTETNQPATNEERTDMTKAAASTASSETPANESAVKKAMEQIEKIKDTLKGVVNDFSDVLVSLKTVEKEKKATEKEIESIRSTLRSLQRVQI